MQEYGILTTTVQTYRLESCGNGHVINFTDVLGTW